MDCATLFAVALVLVMCLITMRNSKSKDYYVGSNLYGLNPADIAKAAKAEKMCGRSEGMCGYIKEKMDSEPRYSVNTLAQAKALVGSQVGRIKTEDSPKLMKLMYDPRYKQYGEGRGGKYHY